MQPNVPQAAGGPSARRVLIRRTNASRSRGPPVKVTPSARLDIAVRRILAKRGLRLGKAQPNRQKDAPQANSKEANSSALANS